MELWSEVLPFRGPGISLPRIKLLLILLSSPLCKAKRSKPGRHADRGEVTPWDMSVLD